MAESSNSGPTVARRTEAGPAVIEGWQVDGVAFVAVKGELDASNVHVLRRVITDLMRDGPFPLALDFSDTDYIDSSATALVAVLAAELRAKRTSLTVVAPSPSPARRVFEVSGLASEIDLAEKRSSGS
jgi:anti-anti-sigma factor